jgi:hypothetical protein
MSCSKPVLSFATIVQGRDSRVRVTDDGLGDVLDVVMVVTGKNCNHSNEALRNLKPSLFDNEKFVIRNGRRYASLRDIIALVMVLPGKMATEMRSQFAEIIENYIRENLCPLETTTGDQVGFKRRREELELLKIEHEINTLMVENKIKEQNSIIAASMEIERIRDPARSNLDDRTRLMIQDALQNSILNATRVVPSGGGKDLLTNGKSPNTPISIGSVAAELGYKPTTNDAKRIGVDIKKRYLRLHNKPPPKHDQLCEGRVTQVNSYTEQDKPLLIEALHDYFAPRSYTNSSCSSSVASIS